MYPCITLAYPLSSKSWFDYICRAGVTFKYSETGPVGLLSNKPVLLVVTTGGLHRDTATDLALAHIRTVLNFIGLQDIQVAYAQGLVWARKPGEWSGRGPCQLRGFFACFGMSRVGKEDKAWQLSEMTRSDGKLSARLMRCLSLVSGLREPGTVTESRTLLCQVARLT